MQKDCVYAHTQTKETYKRDKGITAKQWKVYYYLLSVSKFNSNKVEQHRYVYKNSINISQACRDLGIKSTKTFYNALEKLSEVGLIIVCPDFYKIKAKNWVEIDKTILTSLIKCSKTHDQDIDLLRTFLILKKINGIAETPQERSFTLRQMSELLGHGSTHPEVYTKIRFYLAILHFWGLVLITAHTETDPALGHYTVFHLQGITKQNLNPDFQSDIEAEMNAPLPSEEFLDKLRFVFGED